jgi:hypothetical protein
MQSFLEGPPLLAYGVKTTSRERGTLAFDGEHLNWEADMLQQFPQTVTVTKNLKTTTSCVITSISLCVRTNQSRNDRSGNGSVLMEVLNNGVIVATQNSGTVTCDNEAVTCTSMTLPVNAAMSDFTVRLSITAHDCVTAVGNMQVTRN